MRCWDHLLLAEIGNCHNPCAGGDAIIMITGQPDRHPPRSRLRKFEAAKMRCHENTERV